MMGSGLNIPLAAPLYDFAPPLTLRTLPNA